MDYILSIRKKIGHDPLLSIGLTCLIVNEKDEVLLEKRTDNGKYCLPGGSIELHETALEGVKREVYEETGITLKNPKLMLISSGEKQVFYYPNGDVTYYLDLIFYEVVNSSEIKVQPHDDESTDIRFYPLDNLPDEKDFLRGTKKPIEKYKRKDFEVELD